jgi:hypothetical protein
VYISIKYMQDMIRTASADCNRQVDIPDHTDPPNPGLKIDVEVHLDTDFACHSGGC